VHLIVFEFGTHVESNWKYVVGIADESFPVETSSELVGKHNSLGFIIGTGEKVISVKPNFS
jgi:hypothetical protein